MRSVVMIVMVATVHVMAMVAMSAMVAAPVAMVGAFVEREFVAHADIKFAHESPWITAAKTGREESIIM